MEYILVHFDAADIRDVIANGSVIGKTEKTVMLDTGYYEITLSGSGFTPDKWVGAIAATSRSNPMSIMFANVAAILGATATGRMTKAKPSTKPSKKKRGSAGA